MCGAVVAVADSDNIPVFRYLVPVDRRVDRESGPERTYSESRRAVLTFRNQSAAAGLIAAKLGRGAIQITHQRNSFSL